MFDIIICQNNVLRGFGRRRGEARDPDAASDVPPAITIASAACPLGRHAQIRVGPGVPDGSAHGRRTACNSGTSTRDVTSDFYASGPQISRTAGPYV
jgi:hypothetical protein